MVIILFMTRNERKRFYIFCLANIQKINRRANAWRFILSISVILILAVVLLHYLDEVDYLVRVANLIVIPRYNLNELVCQVNASVSVED